MTQKIKYMVIRHTRAGQRLMDVGLQYIPVEAYREYTDIWGPIGTQDPDPGTRTGEPGGPGPGSIWPHWAWGPGPFGPSWAQLSGQREANRLVNLYRD